MTDSQNHRADYRLRPLPNASVFLGRDVAQGQSDQFGDPLVAREMPARFDYLAQLAVQVFNRVGRIDKLPNLQLDFEERNHPNSNPLPGPAHVGKLLTERALLKGIQRRLGVNLRCAPS